MATSKINKKLWLRVKKYIQAEPRRFHMPKWMIENDSVAPCGTAACLAGTAIILTRFGLTKQAKIKRALRIGLDPSQCFCLGQKLLGLTMAQSNHVFKGDSWPLPFRLAYCRAKDLREHNTITLEEFRTRQTHIAVRLIDKIIETDGAILN